MRSSSGGLAVCFVTKAITPALKKIICSEKVKKSLFECSHGSERKEMSHPLSCARKNVLQTLGGVEAIDRITVNKEIGRRFSEC
jgi:hypothetical protein